MKIITWNVNGLRAALRKNALDWVAAQEPDVICLQETKAQPEQVDAAALENFSGWQSWWNSAERAGYSGVLSLTKQEPLEVCFGLDEPECNREGRVIRKRYPDFWLFNIYFPNGQRDHGRLTYKLDFYAALLEMCNRMHSAGEQIILCGDFNTAHQEIDLRNPKENVNTSGFMPEERAWVDRYLENGFSDVYRELYPERVQYTWWTYRFNARQRNIGWRLDYYLVSEKLMPRVVDTIIHDEVEGSDHCPVSLEIAAS